MMKYKSFTFLVLCFNHEKYIIEHLESIKYLVESYGDGIYVDIIVNDDASRDSTVPLLNKWLDFNSKLFRKIKKIFNEVNIGTCASVINMLNEVETDCFKMTAGDDVYSNENIFEYAFLKENILGLSGIPILIKEGVLQKDVKECLSVSLTQEVYKKKPIIKRFSMVANNNAPNTIYNKYLLSKGCKDFLRHFDVVEDWPLQIYIAKNHPETKMEMVNKTFVYYRRTINSTYIIANKRFIKDKSDIYDFLYENVNSKMEKILIKNRKFLFLNGGKYKNIFFNFSLWIFGFQSIFCLRKAIARVRNIKVQKYISHYEEIKEKSDFFLKN